MDGNSSEYPVEAGAPERSIISFTFVYINDLPDDVLCTINNYAGKTTVYSKRDQALICGDNQSWLLNLNVT